MNEEHGQQERSILRSFEEPRSRGQSCGLRCRAHSAVQSPLRVPQTRSTATALAVALSGKQNRSKHNLGCQPSALMPNPSLKRSANGRPPGPVWRYAVHFRQPGPGVLPLPPA